MSFVLQRRIGAPVGALVLLVAVAGVGAVEPPSAAPGRYETAADAAAAACAAPPTPEVAQARELVATNPSHSPSADPRLRLADACRRFASERPSDGGTTVDVLLDVGEAALATGHIDAAGRLLDALLAAADPSNADVVGDRLARLHIALADLANEKADRPAAQHHFAAAQRALERAGLTNTARQAAVWVGEAAAWRNERLPGALERSAHALDRATALLVALDRAVSPDMSRVLNERTMLAYGRLDLPGTVDAARAELALGRALGLADSTELLDPLVTLGGVLSQLGRFDEAETVLREALRLVELHPGERPAAALGVLNNYATLQSDRGRPADALALADRALATARSAFGTGAARTVTPLTIRGQALARLGRYGEARQAFEAALEVTAVHSAALGPLRRLRLQDTLATVLLALGDTEAAEASIARGLAETSALEGLGYWRGRLMRLRAAMAVRQGEWSAADASIAEAIRLIGPVNGEQHPYVIDMGALQCFAQTQGRLPGEACLRLAAALPALDTAAPVFRFNAMAALAQDDDNHGRADVALTRRVQALAAAESAAAPDPLWSAYATLAAQLRERGAKALAILLGKQAVEQIERMRDALGADLKREERGFLADKLLVYRRLADWLTEDGRIDEALDVVRLLKEEEFYDFANRDGSLFGRADRGPAYADAEALLRRLWRAVAAPAGQGGQTLQLENERVAQRLRDISNLPTPALAAAAPAASPPVLRASPGAGEAWVWLYPGEQRLHLVVDTPSRRTTTTIDVPPAEIAKRVAELLPAIEGREPVLGRLQALHATLGAPIERALAAEGVATQRLLLTVDGTLRYLPFAALHDGRGYLGERYSVQQRVAAPASAVAPTPPARSPTLRVEALGTSRALPGMAPLREVVNEVCGIVSGAVRGLDTEIPPCTGLPRGIVSGSGWLNREFTADRLQSVMASARQRRGAETRLLHIGTHFVLRPGRMSRSWLLLGDGQPLSLADLAAFDFHGQSLVTLSACETGIGGAAGGGSGEEVEGLGTLMMRRGASAVVASLWRVNDTSASHLMQAFYRHLASGLAPAEALQHAQAQLRDGGGREAHPFHWAGFHLLTGAD